MHQNAINSISGKVKNLLNIAPPNNGFLFETEVYNLGERIASEIFKQKGEWISQNDSHTLIYSFFMELLRRLNDQQIDTSNHRTFASLIDVDGAASEFMELVLSIPRNYDVYFPLPSLDSSILLDTTHGERWSLLRAVRDNIEPERGLLGPSLEESFYFRVTINGFLGFSTSSTGMTDALSMLKNFIERGLSQKLFAQVIQFDKGFTPRALQRTYAYANKNYWGRESKSSTDLSLEVSHLLKQVVFHNNVQVSATRTPEQNNSNIEPFLETIRILTDCGGEFGKRLRSASEWHFDSLASEQPSMRLLQITIGLESIYGDETGNAGLTETLSDRCSYSIANTIEERASIKKEFRELYKLRSKIVHGVSKQLSNEELKFLDYGESLLKRSLLREILISRVPKLEL